MGYYNYYSYPKRKPNDPAATVEKLRKKNPNINPIIIDGKLAKSWWAIAWNRNLEGYADYSSRISRGRSYVRSGAVVDLSIDAGEVKALVQGTKKKPYEIVIKIDTLSEEKWEDITRHCSRKISNLEELVHGKFSKELEELFTNKKSGLFPSPSEIKFSCDCPDWAYMCKHVAAVLYGIGARFDSDPTLFFKLRNIEFAHLIKKSVDDRIAEMLKNSGKKTKRRMAESSISKLFGV